MPPRSRSKRWRRLERWQVLLAAIIAAIASIVVAFVSLLPGGGPAPGDGSAPVSSTAITPAPVSLAITSEFEQSHPPPPGRLYMWSGTVRHLPADASIFVIARLPGGQVAVAEGNGSQPWLVSPQATISENGTWTVTWVIPKPPSTVQWIAVVQVPSVAACGSSSSTPIPPCSGLVKPPDGLSSDGSSAPGVLATATRLP
jgi:hypothetical protein